MTEINIILDTDFKDIDKEIQKNDKEIFYEELNKELGIYKYNSYNFYKILYNNILEDFIHNDNFLDYEKEINDIDTDIKKILIKKLLIYFNPIFKFKNYTDNIINKNKNIIIDRNSILLNYPIKSKFLDKHGRKNNIIIKSNSITIDGLYNEKYYNNNLPYSLNNFKYITNNIINNLSKSYKEDIYIYLKSLNYKNISLFNLDIIQNNDLKDLYKLYLECNKVYFNNNYLNYNKLLNEYDIYKQIINYNKTKLELVDKNYSKNYINEFNKFLNYKINTIFNNHSYFAFSSNDLLDLYEQILIYSIDNKEIKNKIKLLEENENNKKIYRENKKIIDEYNLKQIQLEYLTRKKFPNLFNPNSKELIFYKFKPFNLDDLPKKYKEIILIEYKKLQNYKEEYNKNKCSHKKLINNLAFAKNKFAIINEINKLIKNPDSTDYYKCIICSYNLICPHVLEYYNLLFNKKENEVNEFSIRKHIINKYMTDAKINMIYYCKICGEELGKSLDLEQHIQYQDKIKLNVSEYTDDTIELVKKNVNYIVYNYTTFTELNLNVTKKYIINYIMDIIIFYINNLEKKLRKSKLYDEEKVINLIDFNSIIFTYASLIFIMSKYPFISFMSRRSKLGSKDIKKDSIIIPKKDSIIIPKKIPQKDLLTIIKTRFKEAYDIIYSTNNIILHKLNYLKDSEKIKELLLKTYGIIANNDQIVINEKEQLKLSNLNLLSNSNIYNYYYLIKKIYPLSKEKSDKKSSIFNKYNLYISNFNNIKFTEYEKILNKTNINKVDELFDNFKSPIILDNLSKINEIQDYNDYKILSFNLFNYHIKYQLYNLSIYDIISSKKEINSLSKFINDNVYLDSIKENDLNQNTFYKNYINLLQKLKIYEIKLINENIKFNLYPYSLLKLNNDRYFTNLDINLNIYFCTKDGFPHKFNIYLFNINKKEIEIEKNKLDNFINSNDSNNIQYIDTKCSKCLQLKNNLYNEIKYDNKKINHLINEINDINAFFNLYINICPITSKSNEYQFHDFKYEKDQMICSICKINYLDLLNKNKDIYNKFNKEYTNYKQNKIDNFNNKLLIFDKNKKELNNINIINFYKDEIQKNETNTFINSINKLVLDNLIVDLSKKFKIDIIYLQNLGLTEGYSYDEVNTIKPEFNNIDNRINKLNSYLRSLLIYYNILKNNKLLTSYYDFDLNEILNNLKDITNKLQKDLPEYNINLSDILVNIKLTNNNKSIIDFYLKAIYNFILDLDNFNKNKFNNKLDKFIEFIISKVLKFDELFTKYNYSQLKQMFTEDKFDMNLEFENNQEYENEDDDELFGYNDLNINFEDEEPLEE